MNLPKVGVSCQSTTGNCESRTCRRGRILIHSFIQAIYIAPLQIHYYSEALPTQHGHCVGVSRQSTTGNCESRTCPRGRILIHSGYLYSASSSPLLFRGAPDTARTLCRSFTPKHHRQLRVKDLPYVAARVGFAVSPSKHKKRTHIYILI